MINLIANQIKLRINNISMPVLSAVGEVCLAMPAGTTGKLWKNKYIDNHDLPGKLQS